MQTPAHTNFDFTFKSWCVTLLVYTYSSLWNERDHSEQHALGDITNGNQVCIIFTIPHYFDFFNATYTG